MEVKNLYLTELLTIALPMALIQSSFSLSVSAMKNIRSGSFVVISKELGLFSVSSAPFIERQLLTRMTPRGTLSCRELCVRGRVVVDNVELTDVTMSDLNQKIFPCFRTNQRRRHVLMYSPVTRFRLRGDRKKRYDLVSSAIRLVQDSPKTEYSSSMRHYVQTVVAWTSPLRTHESCVNQCHIMRRNQTVQGYRDGSAVEGTNEGNGNRYTRKRIRVFLRRERTRVTKTYKTKEKRATPVTYVGK